jgi:GTPase SAR1 family protein
VNRDERGRVHLKIILWGPFGSGKTAMIKWYYDNTQALDRGGFTSVENDLGQTIYFDYASLSTNGNIIYDVFAVGGSDECARERKALADGSDGIIFVAHSERDKLESTLSSIDELISILGKSYENLPKVFVLNKRDLVTEDLIEEGEFSELPDVKGNRVFETVANIGVGVAETFQYLVSDLAQKVQNLREIPQGPQELTGIGLVILELAEGFEPSVEATYPDGFLIDEGEARAIGSVHSPSATSSSFATVRTQRSQIFSYQGAKRDKQGTSRMLCLVLPSYAPNARVYSLFDRFYHSAPVILRYKDLSSLKELVKTLPQFYILARDLMITKAASSSEPPTIRPRDLLKCRLITEGAQEAIGKGVSYLSLLADQQEYELTYSASKSKAMYMTSVRLDEYATKTFLKEVERIQNNLSAHMKGTQESGVRKKYVQTYLAEINRTLSGMFSHIFNSAILQKIKEDNPEHLALEIERPLLTMPLEIFHDVQGYLCLERSFSRWITMEQGQISSLEKHKLVPRVHREGEPLAMLIVDSRLKKIPPVSRDDFGGRLIGFLETKEYLGKAKVTVESARGELKKEEIKSLLASGKYDIIHIIGPAEIGSGDPEGSSWVFSNGEIRGYELAELFAQGYPQLVVSHVSSPPLEREWDAGQESRIIHSLALSTIAAGTECFVGQVAQKPSENDYLITTNLYGEILRNKRPIGEALRLVRRSYTEINGIDDEGWMKPILYGNPAKHFS